MFQNNFLCILGLYNNSTTTYRQSFFLQLLWFLRTSKRKLYTAIETQHRFVLLLRSQYVILHISIHIMGEKVKVWLWIESIEKNFIFQYFELVYLNNFTKIKIVTGRRPRLGLYLRRSCTISVCPL